jgi:predicted tellurium resistance membrane protein TerC
MIERIMVIATLVLLEGILSADNALVLAVLVKPLPKHQQKKALLYGIGGAFLFRGIAILTAQRSAMAFLVDYGRDRSIWGLV